MKAPALQVRRGDMVVPDDPMFNVFDAEAAPFYRRKPGHPAGRTPNNAWAEAEVQSGDERSRMLNPRLIASPLSFGETKKRRPKPAS